LVRKIPKKKFEELSTIYNCTLGPLNTPVATIKPGETIEVETWDAISGVVTQKQTLKEVIEKNLKLYKNPVTGPIYVEGAEPDDTLAVEIVDIAVPNEGVISVIPGSGGLEGWLQKSPPLTKFCKIRNGKVIFALEDGRNIEIKTKPFIGTIGVAPSSEAIATITPGRHGGNMDTPDVCVGNRLFLPVMTRGALFGFGDVHAVQGDGEICGTAIEIPATVTLKIDLIKNKQIGWPRIESSNEIMTVCSAKPLEDAVRLAFMEMIKWLQNDFCVESYDAYMLLSLTAKIRVSQIVDPLFTVVVRFPKEYLPAKL